MISVHDKAIVSHWVSTSTTFQRPYIHTTVLWLSTVSTKNQLSLTVDVQGRWSTGEVICWYLSNICLVIYVIFSYRWITSLGYSFSDSILDNCRICIFLLIEFPHSLQCFCILGIYDWFSNILFFPKICLTVVLKASRQFIPLLEIYPLENFINYKLLSKCTQYHQKSEIQGYRGQYFYPQPYSMM